MNNPILIFTIATVINITLSTIRSLCTIKGGKWISATTNAICYGFYPLVVMLTAKDTVHILVNMLITAVANFVCVWLIKFCEEKARKDKLWKIEVTVPNEVEGDLHYDLSVNSIPHNYISNVGKYSIFNIYCETQTESQKAKDLLNHYEAKYFVSESKIL
jgi:uncharacterized protein YebE (UPF0316 family)